MIEKPSLSDQRIIDCLNNDYGIEVATLTFLPLGADMDASVYKAQAYDQSSYFVKLKCGYHHDIGAIIQLLLHNAGIQQIISPIKTNHDQPTHHIDDFTFIVYPFIEGQEIVKNAYYLEWDYKHNEVEVYTARPRHLGALDPQTMKIYKPADPDRDLFK